MPSTAYRYLVTIPGVCQGKTIVEGSRIGVHDVMGLMVNSAGIEDVLRSFPDLTRAQVYECAHLHSLGAFIMLAKDAFETAIARTDVLGQCLLIWAWPMNDDTELARSQVRPQPDWTGVGWLAYGMVDRCSGAGICSISCRPHPGIWDH